jgi:spore maturation protein CgeB
MKVLYLGMGHDYGDPQRGESYEEANLHDALRSTSHEVVHWDFCAELLSSGWVTANARLWDVFCASQPDVVFCVLFEEQVDHRVVRRMTKETAAVTIGWFSDDHWRFEPYSRHWAGAFDWVVTTYAPAVRQYRDAGQPHVILSQWACNPRLYRPVPGPLLYDVTFVGQPHSYRRRLIERLRRDGISVETWGQGWERGKAEQDEMTEIFSRSRINLNFSGSTVPTRWGPVRRNIRQVKGRVFEVPACGGLLLTENAPDLDRFFRVGDEIVVFDGYRDLRRRIEALLADEPARAAIAERGMRRTLADHTYARRFEEIFTTARKH